MSNHADGSFCLWDGCCVCVCVCVCRWVETHPEFVNALMELYLVSDIALNVGVLIRCCISHESLARKLLYGPHVKRLFDFVELSSFEVVSDAFATLKEAFTVHKALSAEFLDQRALATCGVGWVWCVSV